MEDIAALEKIIGYTFRDREIVKLALTHPSCGLHHNQRLEFLGDAVLELCVSEKIYEKHPEMQEGGMTQLRQKLVREEKLAAAAEQMHLGDLLVMDKAYARSGGRNNPSVLCDTFEAVLAAIYLDGGMDEARKTVLKFIGDCSETGENDAKSALQEYLQRLGKPVPSYCEVSVEGPPHNRVFTMAVMLEGKQIETGSGNRKQRAEQEAARKALKILMGEQQP